MAIEIRENSDSTMRDFGGVVRMERRWRAQSDGTYMWHVYQLEPVIDKKHPIHGGSTTECEVWMPVTQGTEEQAYAAVRRLIGE